MRLVRTFLLVDQPKSAEKCRKVPKSRPEICGLADVALATGSQVSPRVIVLGFRLSTVRGVLCYKRCGGRTSNHLLYMLSFHSTVQSNTHLFIAVTSSHLPCKVHSTAVFDAANILVHFMSWFISEKGPDRQTFRSF